MKHLLAAATVAALLIAAPAGAQVVFGSPPGQSTTAGFVPGGNWRDAVVIYAEGPDPILVDPLLVPVAATNAGDVSFDVRGSSVSAARANLAIISTQQATSPVPEPATWAMMLVGFGAVGGALRSRRKVTLRYA